MCYLVYSPRLLAFQHEEAVVWKLVVPINFEPCLKGKLIAQIEEQSEQHVKPYITH